MWWGLKHSFHKAKCLISISEISESRSVTPCRSGAEFSSGSLQSEAAWTLWSLRKRRSPRALLDGCFREPHRPEHRCKRPSPDRILSPPCVPSPTCGSQRSCRCQGWSNFQSKVDVKWESFCLAPGAPWGEREGALFLFSLFWLLLRTVLDVYSSVSLSYVLQEEHHV